MAWWHNWRRLFRSSAPALPAPSARRDYEGAGTGRRWQHWTATGSSANTEVHRSAKRLRYRSRDLVRNNAYAAAGIAALVRNIVGEGIRPQSRTGNADLDATVNALWRRWEPRAVGIAPIGVYGLQVQAVRSWLESGEVLIRRRPRRLTDGLPVPLQLQAIEADQLDDQKSITLANGGRIIQGVELDGTERISAYWLFPHHPGETVTDLIRSGQLSQRVRASQIAHLYNPERPGQVRGIPHLAPAVRRFRDLDDYEDAEIMRKKVEACVAGFIETDEGVDEETISGAVTDADGNRIDTLEPGLLAYLRGGKSITFNQPHTVGGYEAFKRAELQSIASAIGLTYELISGDLSKVNFSSIRAGIIEFRRMVRMLRARLVVPMLCVPIWRWFIESAVAAGELPAPLSGSLYDAYPVRWSQPRFEEVDRQKDATADRTELENGSLTFQDLCARRGEDWLDVLEEHAIVKAEAERLGIEIPGIPFYGASSTEDEEAEPEPEEAEPEEVEPKPETTDEEEAA